MKDEFWLGFFFMLSWVGGGGKGGKWEGEKRKNFTDVANLFAEKKNQVIFLPMPPG